MTINHQLLQINHKSHSVECQNRTNSVSLFLPKKSHFEIREKGGLESLFPAKMTMNGRWANTTMTIYGRVQTRLWPKMGIMDYESMTIHGLSGSIDHSSERVSLKANKQTDSLCKQTNDANKRLEQTTQTECKQERDRLRLMAMTAKIEMENWDHFLPPGGRTALSFSKI